MECRNSVGIFVCADYSYMTCETKKKIIQPQNYLNIVICDRYDLVDLTRQVLSKLANQVYRDAMIAFRRKDARALNLHGQKFLQIIKDIDVLLASDDNFLLGTWLESAKKLAVDPNDMKLVRTNSSLALENNSIVIICLNCISQCFISSIIC